MSDRLSDPVFRAAQRVAAHGEGWVQAGAPPAGEVLWREDGDSVRLTTDGWLMYVNSGKGVFYTSRLRATPEHIATLRGPAPSVRKTKPALRDQ